MKRIALVHPRYGLEISGGAEAYTRLIAERLANRYEVEVLTTKAVDSATWKNWYVRDVEVIRGVTVRRFSVQQLRARDFAAYDATYLEELAQGRQNPVTEKIWFEKHGPYAPDCIRYLRRHRTTYDVVLFISDANYLTAAGLPEAADRAIFIPMAQDTPFLQFAFCETLYQKPRAFVFLTDEERRLIRRKFPKSEPIPCEVMGTGIDVPVQPDPALFRRQYGLTEAYLLYVGRVDERKECPMLMRYFMEYKARCGGKLKLVLVGKIVCRIPQHPDILPLGFLSEEDKFDAIAGAKALVIPAKLASLSLTLLEAMAVSVPVIVNGASPVLQGHCKKSNGGLYYQNYFEFEGAVQYLLQHPVEYLQLCSNARNYIAEHYDWNRIVTRFSACIDRIAAERERVVRGERSERLG